MNMATQEWHRFFDACFRNRVPPEKYQTLFKTFTLKHAILQGQILVNVLLDEGRKVSTRQVDPRIPLYVREMLLMGQIEISEVLVAILPLNLRNETKANRDQTGPTNMDPVESHDTSVEALTLQMMTVEMSNGLVKSRDELRAILRTLTKTSLNGANSSALGYFISAILHSNLAQDIFNRDSAKSVPLEPPCLPDSVC